MTTAKLASLVEKLFVMMLAGSCTFMVSYLRDINHSLDTIREKMSLACEQISAVDATIKAFEGRMAFIELRLEETRRGG